MFRYDMFRYDDPHILVLCHGHDKFQRIIPFVTTLYLTLKSPESFEALNFGGYTFSRLQELVLRLDGSFWLDLIPIILNKSPKLELLDICSVNGYQLPTLFWNQPSFVPRCLSSHLEFFKWYEYSGIEEEKQLMRYILATSKYLKEVTITLVSTFNLEEKEMILKELNSMYRVSTIYVSASADMKQYRSLNHICIKDHKVIIICRYLFASSTTTNVVIIHSPKIFSLEKLS
ncbi:putative F-box/FBD/LRR-repeat protein At5g52460 [Eutrema salsugineum]|uniref:putative F-box/FBD/LRR-repeat protein At5g52460 n=1 Tax=Eutrema salsugineum TaxID=72664 RepID=UPI000CED1F6D|nr:putative F-box/FBD/LRR-repeat protein At5g52460 [Eutrema salsugineum]